MAFDIGAIFKIKAGVDGQAQLDRLNQSLRDTKKGGQDVSAAFAGLRGLIVGAFSVQAVISFGRAVMHAGIEGERSINRLNAVLKSTGGAAGLARFEIERLVDEMEGSTGFDDESIRNAAANLMKFGGIQGEVFTKGMRLAADLAAMMDKDLNGAIQMVGKALSSPKEGVTALERSIGKLNPAIKDTIEKLAETGNTAEAQRLILKELEKAVGGQAGAQNTGLAGAANAFTNEWGNLLEALAKTETYGTTAEFTMRNLAGGFKEFRNVIESGTWLERLSYFSGHQAAENILRGLIGQPQRTVTGRLGDQNNAPLTPEQERERDNARRTGEDARIARENAEAKVKLQEWTEKKAEEMRKKAEEQRKREIADNQRLLDEGQRGWVAYAEEIFRIADEENLAMAKLADERLAYEEKMRKLDIDGWVAHAEEVFRLADEENLAMAKIADDGKKQFAELQRAVEGWGRGAAQAFTDWAFGAKGNIKDVVRTMLQEFSTMMVYKNVFSPLATMGSNWLTSVIPKFFHGGGVVGAGGSFGRAVSPLAFAGAPRMHGGGVAGLRSDEVPAVLQKGETVLPRGGAGGGVNVAVTVNMAEGTTQATGNSDGGMQLGKMIGDTVRGILIDEQRPGGLIARA